MQLLDVLAFSVKRIPVILFLFLDYSVLFIVEFLWNFGIFRSGSQSFFLCDLLGEVKEKIKIQKLYLFGLPVILCYVKNDVGWHKVKY